MSAPSGEFNLAQSGVGSFFLSLTVFAPSHALRVLRVPVSPGETLEIPVERGGGTLVVDSSQAKESIVIHSGTFVPLRNLAWWSSFQRAEQRGPGVLVVPNVETGEYAVCNGWETYKAFRAGMLPLPDACDEGVVVLGQELVLKVPADKQPLWQESSPKPAEAASGTFLKPFLGRCCRAGR